MMKNLESQAVFEIFYSPPKEYKMRCKYLNFMHALTTLSVERQVFRISRIPIPLI